MKKQKLIRLNWSYHPNFVQEDSSPQGYRLTGGGEWIVEWVLRDFYPHECVPLRVYHYKTSFPTEQQCQEFEARLRQHAESDGGIFLTQKVKESLGIES